MLGLLFWGWLTFPSPDMATFGPEDRVGDHVPTQGLQEEEAVELPTSGQ